MTSTVITTWKTPVRETLSNGRDRQCVRPGHIISGHGCVVSVVELPDWEGFELSFEDGRTLRVELGETVEVEKPRNPDPTYLGGPWEGCPDCFEAHPNPPMVKHKPRHPDCRNAGRTHCRCSFCF